MELLLCGRKALLLAVPMEKVQAGHLQTSAATSPSGVKSMLWLADALWPCPARGFGSIMLFVYQLARDGCPLIQPIADAG